MSNTDFDYEKAWQQVDSLEQKNLTRSALQQVESIYEAAEKEKEGNERIKSLLYQFKYRQIIEEKTDSLIINRLTTEVEKADLPEKQILQSILAQSYQQYYRNNRWSIVNRTALEVKTEDFQTWDAKIFDAEISKHYMASLEPTKALQKQSIRKFEKILVVGKDSEKYRPNLYDLLAHRALGYFQNNANEIAQEIGETQLKDKDVLADASSFLKLKPKDENHLSKQEQITHIFQQLLRKHQGNNADAYLEAEFARLRYFKTHSAGEQQEQLYQSALESLSKSYTGKEGAALINAELATLYVNQGRTYQPFEAEEHQWKLKEARDLAQKTLKEFPESRGAGICQNLITQIERKRINPTIEDVNLPGRAFRLRLGYQNVSQMHFRVIPFKESYENNRRRDELIAKLVAAKPIKDWSAELKVVDDYQTHATELAAPALEAGTYMLLVSDDASFAPNGNVIAYTKFQVSQLSMIYNFNEANANTDVYVMDRVSGEPLAGVKVDVYHFPNYSGKRKKFSTNLRTNKDGHISFKAGTRYAGYELDLTTKKDHYTSPRIYAYGRPNHVDSREVVHFFTDRSIYRPGQTIYFKALVLHKEGTTHKIKGGQDIEVQFLDVNYQEIQKLQLKTNEYGTAQGSFIAPQSGLLGRMQISATGGSKGFRVEEYKRPTFEVKFEPIKGTYALNDQISITGLAKSYAGANLADAKISYRVFREAKFPYWYFWRGPQPSSPAREIAFGEITSNEDGEFEIDFEAIPDPNLKPEQKPVFTYRISADVVDVSGETQSGSTWLQIGYVPIAVSLEVPEKINSKSPGSLIISSKNLSGEIEEVDGTLKIESLEMPDRILRERRWARVDQHIYNQADYIGRFSRDVYADEDKPQNWKTAKQVQSESLKVGDKTSVNLKMLNNPGWYKITYSATDYEVEISKYVQVVGENPKKAAPSNLTVQTGKSLLDVGEKAEFNLFSSNKQQWVLYQLSQGEKILDRDWILLKKKGEKLSIPIQEMHRGGIQATFAVVRNNQLIRESYTIQVPWTNKELKLEWMSFRSELLPGQEEQWKLKISGPKGEAVAAELVAGMYDASLDAFASNDFGLSLNPTYGMRRFWGNNEGFQTTSFTQYEKEWNKRNVRIQPLRYDRLNMFGFAMMGGGGRLAGGPMVRSAMPMMSRESSVRMKSVANEEAMPMADAADMEMDEASEEMGNASIGQAEGYAGGAVDGVAESEEPTESVPQIRTNLNETAFFFPQLQTNAAGEIELVFTMPEALTRWKFLGLAHTKDLEVGKLNDEVITQKELMVTPNLPRFMREGDKITLTAKVDNLSEGALEGMAELILLNALNQQPIRREFGLEVNEQAFSVEAGKSSALAWEVEVPTGAPPVIVQVVAKAGDKADGEEHVLPILSNRLLVTESMPMAVRGNSTEAFSFKKLVENDSETLTHQQVTLEFTSNPAWYAVQALPYMMEFPHECTEQIYSRFYANALASHIANGNPKMNRIFDQWRSSSPNDVLAKQSLLSNLEKNQELKSVMLSETPWVLNAQDETERKKRVGLLFDLNRMRSELSNLRSKLAERQSSNGAFPWFPGMRESRYITQLIMTGMGQLDKLGVSAASQDPEVMVMSGKAIPYLDREIAEDYENLRRYKRDLEENNLGAVQIQYLYMRSFYPQIPVARGAEKAHAYYMEQARKYWTDQSNYMQGMLSIVFHRNEESARAKEIIAALKENAVFSKEMGMYWKQPGGYYWYQAPIEQQSLLIEAFAEVAQDLTSVDEMKVWLLKNKQTNDWKTTRATAAACNALLSQGTDWLSSEEQVKIEIAGAEFDPTTRADAKLEAGTGYFKTAWPAAEVTSELGEVKVSKSDNGIAWGAMYWQYFEDMDKITFAETPLSLRKTLFIEENTASGPQLKEVDESMSLKPGDKIKVRIELRVDRDMEYVHMKDLRAAGFAPINVLSGYRYQNGLGYYESTKDAATHFFFDRLRKGTHVFEYPLRVSHEGTFSNGIATIQCMYAPEFTSHSEGLVVKVGE